MDGELTPEQELQALDVAELRTAVNNTRACLRGLHKIARAANALVADLEERLETFDHRIASTTQAQEAQHARETHPDRIGA